jgi:hypothetical protein
MRSMIFAALVAATMISVASAEDVSKPSEDVSKPSPPPTPATTPKEPGISPQQQAKIPYIPCTEALGWVHGRLRCDNRY